jgi:two-component system osmolarity sensor histidine kinase EnvZ
MNRLRSLLSAKRFVPRRLFWRSFLIVLVPVVLLQGVVALIFLDRHLETVSRRLALAVAGDVAMLRDLYDRPADANRDWFFTEALVELQLETRLEPKARLTRLQEGFVRGLGARALFQAVSERIWEPVRIRREAKAERYRIEIGLGERGVLNVLVPEKRMRSSTTHIFFLWTIGAAILVVGVAVIFLRNQMRPISRLARAAEAFGKGRPFSDLKPSGAYEVRQATTAFLDMQARIHRQITQRTEMLAGVSHDLRTPLTRMRLELALLAEKHGAEADLNALESDVAEMERMIDEYLAFARGQEGEAPVESDIVELLDHVIENLRRNGGEVALESERPLVITLRPGAIQRCLTNLLDNAVRYGSRARVSVQRRASVIEITIDDDGPGIPPEAHEMVFRPFMRLASARDPNRGGAGLGLTIALDIARGHGGNLELADAPSGGLRVVLTLPV